MIRRKYVGVTLGAAVLVAQSYLGQATAAAVPVTKYNRATSVENPGTSVEGAARRLKDQATALHRAGEYREATEEFKRAVELLEREEEGGDGRSLQLPSTPTLSAVRCSLAAAQLKSGDPRGAEATCSQLLGTPGLPITLRQKASYRRALARKRRAEMETDKKAEVTAGGEGEGEGEGGEAVKGERLRLAVKAFRDAYLAVKLSQVQEGTGRGAVLGPPGGDAKAVGLLAEMESEEWGKGLLTESNRSAARVKADSYLALLAKRKASEEAARYGGMSKMLQGFAGGREGGIKGGGTAAGGMMEALVSGAGGAIGGGAGSVPDKEQMVKMAKKMTLVVKKQLREPSTQHLVCSFLKKAEPDTVKSLADAVGVPVNEGLATRVSKYLKGADGKTLESWIDLGEIAAGVFRRLSQLSVLWSRGIALAGVWLVWVWLRACFAPILLTEAKA